MNQPTSNHIDFADVLAILPGSQIWEYDPGVKWGLADVAKSTNRALQAPLDFPPLSAAIVPGDRVALAIDPNVPQLAEVIQGILDALSHTEASDIDVVLWDEATDQTVDSLRRVFPQVSVMRHQSDDRAFLRYLAADELGDPLYLNRLVVDADFALPVIAHRAMDGVCQHDLTGVYPSMSDSATRIRHQIQMCKPEPALNERNEDQIPWLLGLNLMLAVKASPAGKAAEIIAGTPEAIGKQVVPVRRASDDFPPPAELVIAALDGDSQQQTWANAARAAVAASRYVQPGGTIVLWTAIDAAPTGQLQALDEFDDAVMIQEDATRAAVDEEGKLPAWHADDAVARTLARVSTDFRVLIHSRLAEDVIESMGIGCIENTDELTHLCDSFDSCGVIRAAPLAGSTIDAPHRLGIET